MSLTLSSLPLHCRIPESKQHMVLPEIQEEDEDPYGNTRLSLTSLLLGE